MTQASPQRVLILGGGFAGVYAALEFEKILARDPGIDVTLVSRDNFFLFTPMLHEVAASDLDITNIVNPIRKLLRRVRFFRGTVESVDLAARTVSVYHAEGAHGHVLPYDHLVIALGATTNFFNIPGLADRALTMKSLGDAIELRNRLIHLLEEADLECAIGDRGNLLSVVVAGGGFAGVETIAAINDFLREALPYYSHLTAGQLRLVLVELGPAILPELGAKLGGYAQAKLAGRGVDIRVNTGVKGFTERGVELSDGSLISAQTLIWTAGTSPNPLLAALPGRKDRGRLCVNEFLEVAEHPGVWALGDCAMIPDLTTGRACPPTAQHALREGKVLARNIYAAIRGDRRRPFVFKTIGQLAAIGRRTGVARILGVNFSGFIAWWLWRTIYLSKLPRFEKKLRVILDWTLDLLFSKDLVQFATVREQTISRRDSEPEASRIAAAVASAIHR
jgi:NADH dehydrogenase